MGRGEVLWGSVGTVGKVWGAVGRGEPDSFKKNERRLHLHQKQLKMSPVISRDAQSIGQPCRSQHHLPLPLKQEPPFLHLGQDTGLPSDTYSIQGKLGQWAGRGD